MSRDHGDVSLNTLKIAERILIEGYYETQQQRPLHPHPYSDGGLWKRSLFMARR